MPRKPAAFSISISTQTSERRHFFANPRASKTGGGITVVCGGWERCAPDYVIERDGFRFHAVEFVARGRGTLCVFGREYELGPGMLFSYGPGVPHRITTDAGEPLEKYFVDFGGRYAAGLVRDLQAAGAIRAGDGEFTRTCFERLLEAGERVSGLGGTGAAKQLRVMSLLVELIVHHAAAGTPPRMAGADVSRRGYERCLALLRENFQSLGSAAELARIAHMDAAYMSRLFQRHGNESPYRMLVRLKMNHAAEQLATGAQSLKEIGGNIGFPDPYHFSRVFKRVHGLPPGRFRKSYHRGAECGIAV